MTTNSETANDLRAQAAQHEQDAHESWERSDTDGFLSQWASGISAQVKLAQARIVENGGVAEFPALFDLDGNFVPSKAIETRYGMRWMVLDSAGKATGEFLPYFPARRDTLAKRGYVEGFVTRPAIAKTTGSGRGLSGLCSVRVATFPADNPWESPVSVVSSDRWSDGE
jgi:hypothetical protein